MIIINHWNRSTSSATSDAIRVDTIAIIIIDNNTNINNSLDIMMKTKRIGILIQ